MLQLRSRHISAYTDIQLVNGVRNGIPTIQEALYKMCKTYFFEHYQRLMFCSEEDAKDIFQNTFITLWQHIERGKIFVSDGILMGNNNMPLKGTLNTYLMGIAKLKYKEFIRSDIQIINYDEWTRKGYDTSLLYPSVELITEEWIKEEDAMQEVVADSIALLSERCCQILTKALIEQKDLESILNELPTFQSKDALKTAKSKCLQRLKESVLNLYQIRMRNDR
ncbi:MAG: sigma-70 family RNA polymerase sigma factor [Bacteroidales bacterium]|nr:sigma-70 family RNA polymerase sigma factor [Candidatus Colicola equi]